MQLKQKSNSKENRWDLFSFYTSASWINSIFTSRSRWRRIVSGIAWRKSIRIEIPKFKSSKTLLFDTIVVISRCSTWFLSNSIPNLLTKKNDKFFRFESKSIDANFFWTLLIIRFVLFLFLQFNSFDQLFLLFFFIR